MGAEVGAIDEVVAFPNPPKVGAGAAVVVVAMDPNEGVVEVLVEPKAGTVELLTAPNAGGAGEDDDDDVPNANEVEPAAPKAGGVAEDVITDAAGVGAAPAAGLAAPPNEKALVAGVADAALVVTGFAPKLNPPAGAAELAVEVVVTVPKAGGAVVAGAAAAELAGGLNALNPLAPKAIGFACVEVVVATAG